MRHWHKWGLAALGAMLLVGGIGYLAGVRSPQTFIERVEAAVSWPLWTNPGTKIVPIVSAGSPGIRLGAAQVTGPKALVTRVSGVLQIDGEYKGVRAKILVPSKSLDSITRVQGTAVTAVLQYKLVDFSGKKKAATSSQASQAKSSNSKCPKPAKHDNGKHKGQYKRCGGK
jgi:hypothetical protein